MAYYRRISSQRPVPAHCSARPPPRPSSVAAPKMSLSPSTSVSNHSEGPALAKRRRTDSMNIHHLHIQHGPLRTDMPQSPLDPSMHTPTTQGSSAVHIPKRGARACTNCRKGKNRCEGEVRLSFHSIRLIRPAHRWWPAPSRPARSPPPPHSRLVVGAN